MKSYNIPVIPGDGTGPEVLREGIKVLYTISKNFGINFNYTYYAFGGQHYLKRGEILPDGAIGELSKYRQQRDRAPMSQVLREIGVTGSAPGNFAQLASAYRAEHGVGKDDLKRAMAHVSVKSHANGAKNPKAHLQKAIDMDTLLNAPMSPSRSACSIAAASRMAPPAPS